MSETILKPRAMGMSTQAVETMTIAQAFDAGWAAHRDGIHWKRCGLADDDLRHAWQGGWASREAAGRVGVLP
jgi:hypothetical protein